MQRRSGKFTSPLTEMRMFLESICILDGRAVNLEAHRERMGLTGNRFGFTAPQLPDLEQLLPESLRKGKVKCRIEYDGKIRSIGFDPYRPKPVCVLRLVEAEGLDYSFKYSDRSRLDALNDAEPGHEVLIVQGGEITDTTYSNVVLRKAGELFTPSASLLNGTKRQKLLRESIVREMKITVDNLGRFDHLYLINAMLDIEDGVGVPVKEILPGYL
jgi:4-amino-4-deoxychorismate lyase